MVNLNTDDPNDEPTQDELDAYELSQLLNQHAAEFDLLCQERHAKGAQEYGEITFLGNDVVRMLLEEMADVVNYCRMQAVKLLILQNRLETEVLPDATDDGEVNLGWQAFKGTKPTGWDKP
jgi:hypothetical protein